MPAFKRTSELPKPGVNPRKYVPRDLHWDYPRLRLGVRGRVLATIRQDKEFPKLFRIDDHLGISDIVNLTRAKDAAVLRALNRLNEAYYAYINTKPVTH